MSLAIVRKLRQGDASGHKRHRRRGILTKSRELSCIDKSSHHDRRLLSYTTSNSI